MNQVMADLLMEKHLDKAFIGRRSRGFDFLGYWFSPSGLGVAQKTVVSNQTKSFFAETPAIGITHTEAHAMLPMQWQILPSFVENAPEKYRSAVVLCFPR
ncbi:hypothetical protein NG799_26855 [Laspinema sp. D1]|uniref:Uncharacterized protein n=1 Tax=Laspinema palackyanum D2a TaxID=2953684 RepID=A0ABT2MYU8_9CYAN|nr:hypothetical protein [Laspinema sp. D2a]